MKEGMGFIPALREQYGFTIGSLRPELHAAKILAYCVALDAAMNAISLILKEADHAEAEAPSGGWFAVAKCQGHEIPETIFGKILHAHTEDLNFVTTMNVNWQWNDKDTDVDDRLSAFCFTLWRELGGNDSGIEPLSEQAREFECKWVDEILVSANTLRKDGPLAIIDISSGVGNRAVRATATAVEVFEKTTIHAASTDPVALQTCRLRLFAWSRSHNEQGGQVTFDRVFGETPIVNASTLASRNMLLFCDCLPVFPSGVKASVDAELENRLERVLTILTDCSHSLASLRVPADFLDGKEYSGLRQRVFETGRPVWVRFDGTQERPGDKRLARAVAMILVGSTTDDSLLRPKGYEKVRVIAEMRYSFLPSIPSGLLTSASPTCGECGRCSVIRRRIYTPSPRLRTTGFSSQAKATPKRAAKAFRPGRPICRATTIFSPGDRGIFPYGFLKL